MAADRPPLGVNDACPTALDSPTTNAEETADRAGGSTVPKVSGAVATPSGPAAAFAFAFPEVPSPCVSTPTVLDANASPGTDAASPVCVAAATVAASTALAGVDGRIAPGLLKFAWSSSLMSLIIDVN